MTAGDSAHRIQRLDCYRIALPLATPLAHSQVATTVLDELVLVMTLADGTRGFGEVRGNGAYATGHDAASVQAALAACAYLLVGTAADLAGATVLHQTGNRLAAALVELAALDALSRQATLPMWRYLKEYAEDRSRGTNGFASEEPGRPSGTTTIEVMPASPAAPIPPRLETHASVAFMAPVDAAARAGEATAAGFRRFKVRVGSPDPEDDVARVAAIRAVAPAASLVIDANGAWKVDEAIARVDRLRPLGIAWVEQPTAPGDDAALRAVREQSEIAVVADESVRAAADVCRLAAAGAVDGVHLKLEKCGTVAELRAAVRAAREARLLVEIGMMDQGRLGSAGIAAIASTVVADAYELWGFERVARDIAHGLEMQEGGIALSDLPGNGMMVDLPEEARVATWP
ncbi:MAG: enolase C-terminal domain-like protein [Thermomicrobiales bacterium]